LFVSSVCDSKIHDLYPQSLKYNTAIIKYNENKYTFNGTVIL
jgi:hypothetical protein